jgi:hypothetical protein
LRAAGRYRIEEIDRFDRNCKLMKICFYVFLAMWFCLCVQTQTAQTKTASRSQAVGAKYGCLPNDVKADTVVAAKQISTANGVMLAKETVSHRLNRIGGRCRAGRLIDRAGRAIRFYRLQTCWGNPPADYLEILEAEKNELRALRKKFTVIEIACNPSGALPF